MFVQTCVNHLKRYQAKSCRTDRPCHKGRNVLYSLLYLLVYLACSGHTSVDNVDVAAKTHQPSHGSAVNMKETNIDRSSKHKRVYTAIVLESSQNNTNIETSTMAPNDKPKVLSSRQRKTAISDEKDRITTEYDNEIKDLVDEKLEEYKQTLENDGSHSKSEIRKLIKERTNELKDE